MRLAPVIALASWFAGGTLLGLIEILTLPSDPVYSTFLQLLPLLLLVVGLWFVISEYQKLRSEHGSASGHLKRAMDAGWFAVFAVDAGVASLNNMATEIFHGQLPYYYQGVSLAQKVITLAGIFLLGTASTVSFRKHEESSNKPQSQESSDFWEKPLTNIGFIALLMEVVAGLAQYWLPVVFAGFTLLLAGIMLYPIGRLTEKNSGLSDDEGAGGFRESIVHSSTVLCGSS